MFINKLSQLYKPKRILYYIEPEEEEKKDFYGGKVCEKIGQYTNAFGAYDYPGLFYVRSLEKEVIGIEYRMDDDRVSYPSDLKSMILPEAYFYAIEIDQKGEIGKDFIRETFEKIAKDDDAHRIYSDLSKKEEPGLIGIFTYGKKTRILYEWNLDSDRAGYIMNGETEQIDKEVLYRMALFDPITKHYNWNHLSAYLEVPKDQDIADYGFVHFDIKAFRVVNEVYGHVIANRLLRRVVEAMNQTDFVYSSARCHNDNFAMLIKDMPEEETVEKLREFFHGLQHLPEDPNYLIYFRCGVVPMQRAILLGNRVADAGKMAQALGTSPNKTDVIIYTDQMHDDISWSNFIKGYVDTAIEQDEFVVYLQPKFEIREEKIVGAEALIRWNYKNEEFLYPSRFVPFFEKDGSIGKIDDIVLHKVCRAFVKWKEEGSPLYPISVNISRSQLYDKNLITHLTEIVDSYQVSHSLIDFELTESATYDNMDQLIQALQDLRERGFKISMDDFGTGYSSLSLLTEMPLDTLKIDKSFVDKVGTAEQKEKDLAVMRHIVSLAKELRFVCLAEGAESKSQVDILRALGCEVIQGYYYSKPVSMEEYEEKYL